MPYVMTRMLRDDWNSSQQENASAVNFFAGEFMARVLDGSNVLRGEALSSCGYSRERVDSQDVSIGDNIKRLREASGQTNAAAFARRIGVTPGTLGDWEAGTYKLLRLDSLLKIASAIPCSVDELIAGVDEIYEASKTQRKVRENPDLSMGKSLAMHRENTRQSPRPTSEPVGPRPQGGTLVTTGGGAPGATPGARAALHERAAIAEKLLQYADWLRDSEHTQTTLRDAAEELLHPEDGKGRTRRAGPDAGTRSAGRHHSRKGRS